MDLKCAFENITVPTELAGIDDIIANINDGIKSCSALSFFLYKFPSHDQSGIRLNHSLLFKYICGL